MSDRTGATVPANATNAVGTNHVLTITINALGGTIDAGPHKGEEFGDVLDFVEDD